MAEVTAFTRSSIEVSAAGMPFEDTADFADAERGFVGRSDERQVLASDGRLVWDLDAYSFLEDPCPDTAHPSLWRQSQLLVKDGLFAVVPGIYQVRGYDLSVISFIESETGVIVVDPLVSTQTAAAAFQLYRAYRGDRPVRAMIYTHSHADHFGGAAGIISQAQVDGGEVQVIAPEGFSHHAVSENVFAGTAMTRRAGYMYGAALEKGPMGQIGAGLGQTTSTGDVSLILPTIDVGITGSELAVDGVTFVFQYTPGTEAPAEFNFYLPQFKALCTAENTSHNLHNILTLRGAQVRDPRAWADYMTETIELFGDDLEVVFASHHWPTWGREQGVEFLSAQRDMYSYIHDQTLRMLNQGYVGAEIAEVLEMPPGLAALWHTHGYYGSVSHNVKAVYQRYLGWYDGNPAHLWQHPPVEASRRYVAAMGGAEGALGVAHKAFDEGDYRWAAEVLDRIIFADEDNAEAKELQAQTFEQIGFGAENGTWRNAFLAGARELRHGVFGTPVSAAGLARGLSVAQVFAAIAIRVDGPRAWNEQLSISWRFPDLGERWVTELRHGTLVARRAAASDPDGPMIELERLTLIEVVTGQTDVGEAVASGKLHIEGDPSVLGRLVALLAPVDDAFPLVNPGPNRKTLHSEGPRSLDDKVSTASK